MSTTKRISWLQVLRRVVQVGALAVVAAVVFLSLYGHYRAARALEDEQFLRGWQGAVLQSIDQQVNRLEEPEAFLEGNRGTAWSMRFLGVELTDPLAFLEATAASRKGSGRRSSSGRSMTRRGSF